MITIDTLRSLCNDDAIELTLHQLERMRQRGIEYEEMANAISVGEIIEQYPTDYPFPSCLVLGNGLHVVCGVDSGTLFAITAYRPNSEKWEDDLRTRKGGNK